MQHRLHTFALGVVVVSGLVFAAAAAGEGPTAAAAEGPKWNLDRLNREPFRLVKVTPDPQAGQVHFLIEFTRPPMLGERFDWEQRGGPVVFRLLDEDGVVLRTLKPRLDGELVSERGARIRLVLQVPDARLWSLTRSVFAE
jgi:hypothetical protein